MLRMKGASRSSVQSDGSGELTTSGFSDSKKVTLTLEGTFPVSDLLGENKVVNLLYLVRYTNRTSVGKQRWNRNYNTQAYNL